MNPRVDGLAWLAPGLALLVGRQAKAMGGGETLLDGSPAASSTIMVDGFQLLTLETPAIAWPGERIGRLAYRGARGEVPCDPADLSAAVIDLQGLLRRLAPLSAEARAACLDFLASAPDRHPAAAGLALTRTLVAIREALRERLVPCSVSRDEPIGLAVECLLAIDERHFFIQGWLRDVEAPVTSLRAVSPEGSSIELLDRIHRFQRPDLEALYGVPPGDPRAGFGFACGFESLSASTAPHGWIVELRNSAGSAVEASGPAVISSRDEVRNRLLGDLGLEGPGEETLTRDHLHPAINRLQELNSDRMRIDRVIQFGEPPPDPDVSIVVPLYRRIDFLEHQLAQFSLDPEIGRSDLIYVLDSPERTRDLLSLAASLTDLYRVPFRIVSLAENVGFAGANRAGASLARGRLLLFMNSDVLPENSGWLGRMVSFHDSTPGIGALGPKLLFEDDSIQHAGLFFRRAPGSAVWSNEHYFKGLHRDVPPATASRAVPAVTAACLLISHDLFDEVGGFRSMFVRGDFEDSDLCLRLVEQGRQNWYLADVALYHLEGQSYESSLRAHAWRYNAWLHTHMWGEQIGRLMREHESGPQARDERPPVRLGELVEMEAR